MLNDQYFRLIFFFKLPFKYVYFIGENHAMYRLSGNKYAFFY